MQSPFVLLRLICSSHKTDYIFPLLIHSIFQNEMKTLRTVVQVELVGKSFQLVSGTKLICVVPSEVLNLIITSLSDHVYCNCPFTVIILLRKHHAMPVIYLSSKYTLLCYNIVASQSLKTIIENYPCQHSYSFLCLLMYGMINPTWPNKS